MTLKVVVTQTMIRLLTISGLIIYASIIIFTAIEIWYVFDKFSHFKWQAIPIALALDALILYYAFVNTLYPSRLTKIAAYSSMIYLMFIVNLAFYKFQIPNEFNVVNIIPFLISLFVPLTGFFMGKIIANLYLSSKSENNNITSNDNNQTEIKQKVRKRRGRRPKNDKAMIV